MTDYSKVTRVHVANNTTGDYEEFWGDEWLVFLQDDGTTLKIIGKGTGDAGRIARANALAADLGEITRKVRSGEWMADDKPDV